MKVLLVAPHVKVPGTFGGSVHHQEFSKAMEELGNEMVLLVDSEKDHETGGIKYYSAVRSKLKPKQFWDSVFSVKKTFEICKREKIDVIHDRTDPGQLCGILVSKITGIPLVNEVNINFLAYEKKGNFIRDTVLYPFVNLIKSFWVKMFLERGNAIVCVSNTIKKSLVKHGLKSKKIFVIPNGANLKKFSKIRKSSARRDLKLSLNDIVISLMGELGPRHGAKEAIIAVEKLVSKYPNIRLLLVGGSKKYKSHIQELKKNLEKNNLEKNIIMTGTMPKNVVTKIVVASDICLAPFKESDNREKFGFSPIKVFEYMAAGKIVIASDREWMREIIKNGKNGFLVKDLENLDRTLEKVIKIKNKEKIGRAAKLSVQISFNWKKTATEVTNIYKNLMKNIY